MDKARSKRLFQWVVVVILLCIFLREAVSVRNARKSPGHLANPERCAHNLNRIGQAIMLYANDNRGLFPPAFDALVSTGRSMPEDFVCPSSSDIPATGPTTRASAGTFLAGGHCSYTYVPGLTFRDTAETVVAYETNSRHQKGTAEGALMVLFADGHVELISSKSAQFMQAELGAGRNPPRWAANGGLE